MLPITRKQMNRRKLLRGAGAAAISLPFLEAMGPTMGKQALGGTTGTKPPKRFVAICAGLGFHGPHLFPDREGADFSTPYLEQLADNHDKLTLFSGLSHPEQQGNNGHASDMTWLTSAQRPGLAGFRNTVSFDQLIAEKIGPQTRFPFLALANAGTSLSWTRNGVNIPALNSPSKLFQALFIQGNERAVKEELAVLSRGRSILDTVGDRARRFASELGNQDRRKLEEYLSSVRDLEVRLKQSEDWVQRPKPKVDRDAPQDIDDKTMVVEKQQLMYAMITLALQTDSSRSITLQLGALNAAPKVEGVNSDWHQLSHHGKDPDKINELTLIEQKEFAAFNDFLTDLRRIDESGHSLLDQSAVLFGSNLGNASAHDWHNLPIILAGGGYQHGKYVAHDDQNNTPLANLFVEMAQRMGVEMDRFGSSTAASVRGLDS